MSGDPIDFADDVVVITGAGRGIGRGHAVELADRGARVVVNDVDAAAAEAVATEVRDAGGQALVSTDSAATRDGARALIAGAVAHFGTVHAVINNAAVMRNGYIDDLGEDALDAVLGVGLRGTFFVSQAAWPVLRDQGYGRIVMTSSAGGMFAMQGESNYAAAKGGVYGLGKALASEGRDHGIRVNTILPMASTSMGADDPVPGHAERYPSWAGDVLGPRRLVEAISPLVALLASRECSVTGEAFSVGFGRFARVFVGETPGWSTDDPAGIRAEDVRDHFDRVRDLDGFAVPADIYEEVAFIATSIGVEPPAAS